MSFLEPTRQSRWVFYLGTYFYVLILYLTTNHQHWIPKHYLPLTPVDQWTPFLPWTSWIYILVYFLPLLMGAIVHNQKEILRVVWTFAGLSTFCAIIFLVYPTTYPRPEAAMYSDQINWALSMVYLLDTPANCMPSQHVAFAFLSAFFIHKNKREWGNAAIIVAILISISTLTTKQHYVWDIVTGYVLARISYWISEGRLGIRSEVAR